MSFKLLVYLSEGKKRLHLILLGEKNFLSSPGGKKFSVSAFQGIFSVEKRVREVEENLSSKGEGESAARGVSGS